MRVRGRLTEIAALALFALAACQPLPRPFAPNGGVHDNPLLRLKDRGGVVVLDVDGVPDSMARALPEATAAALHSFDVPASTRSANRRSRFLFGTAETSSLGRGRIEVKLTWEMVDPDGAAVGRHVVTGSASEASWNGGAEALVRRFAEASARGVAAFIQPPPRGAPAVPILRPLHVMPVIGVNDGQGDVLRRAMAASLRRLEVDVAPVRGEGGLAVFGNVALGPATAGKRRIEVSWSVREPDKPEVGSLKQANIVPIEALGDQWPDLARVIAAAAAPAIVEVVRRGAAKSEARR